MRTAEFVKIGKQLLPHFPGFAVERDMLVASPIGDFLRGVCFENSSGTKEFYVRPLFLPLFVPQECISFCRDRIRRNGRSLWNVDDPGLIVNLRATIQSEAIPFLNSVSTLSGALDYLRTEVARTRPRLSSHTLEGFAFTLVKAGDYATALEALSELEHIYEDLYEGNGKEARPYVLDQRGRARLMKEKLSRNPDEALAQLDTWEAKSKSKFKLQKYP